jgi:hypothetical protein
MKTIDVWFRTVSGTDDSLHSFVYERREMKQEWSRDVSKRRENNGN